VARYKVATSGALLVWAQLKITPIKRILRDMGSSHHYNKKTHFFLIGLKFLWFTAMEASIRETYNSQFSIKIKTYTLEEKKM
jgi:hypothetical protein